MAIATPTNADVFNLPELFQKVFGSKPYVINKEGELSNDATGDVYKIDGQVSKAEKEFTAKGSLISEKYLGVEIFLPIRFFDNGELLMYMPYCVIKISSKKTLIRTPLLERKGTVKEQYNIDDYQVSIKGFLIGEDRKFPEEQLTKLKQLYESKAAISIDNALTNIFLTDPELKQDEQRRIVISDFDLPEVSGGRKHVRPFTMQLESDHVFILEFE